MTDTNGGPERIWTASTIGKCHVGFDTPSMNYTNEYIRADVARAERDAHVAAARIVKPLEWEDFDGRGAKATAWGKANYLIARWSDGRYEISASYPGYETFIEGTDRFYPTLEAAKDAAQAHHQACADAMFAPTTALADLLTRERAEAWNAAIKAAAERLAQVRGPMTRNDNGIEWEESPAPCDYKAAISALAIQTKEGE